MPETEDLTATEQSAIFNAFARTTGTNNVSPLLAAVHDIVAAREAAYVEMEGRFSELLCDLTDGLLSKTNYDVRAMVQQVEATFEKYADEACAVAWDEGFTAGFYDPLAGSSAHDASESTRTNPYRATEEDA